MSKDLVDKKLQEIQDVIAGATGGPLRGRSRQALKRAIAGAFGGSELGHGGRKFGTREVTILLADLRGFALISEAYSANTIFRLLNRYFTSMSGIIIKHGGAIDKLMGDSIMVIFDQAGGRDDSVRRAVLCAVQMQIAMATINRPHKKQGLPELFIGVGINTGTVIAGMLGSQLHSEYTVIGEQVNLASRIEAFSLRGQVLISESTFERCRDYVKTGTPNRVYVKGKSTPLNLYEVQAIPSLELEVPRLEGRKSPRVKVDIASDYQLVQNKIVIPDVHHGTVRDLSYYGALIEVDRHVPAYSEIKLDLDLPLVKYSDANVYGRITATRANGKTSLLGVEFTSVSDEALEKIRHLVQLLVQGGDVTY